MNSSDAAELLSLKRRADCLDTARTRFKRLLFPECNSRHINKDLYENAHLDDIFVVDGGSYLYSWCSDMTSGENAGVAGILGGSAVGGIARASGMSTGQAAVTGAAAGALIGTVTYIIAKREATERQQRIAEERARLAYAQMSAERKATMKQKKVRYIAVDTEKDEHTDPAAKETVMVWDTETEKVASDKAYDVKTPPPVGSTAKFDTYSAEYVGLALNR